MILIQVAHFFLSEWLWGVTWGGNHLPFNIIFTILLLKIFLRMNMVPAVFMAIISQAVAWIAFTGITLISMWSIGVGGGPESFIYTPQPFFATVFLGLIYAMFQIIFFSITKSRYQTLLSTLIVITLIANNLAILVTWLLFSIE
jgi:hypothetical protein